MVTSKQILCALRRPEALKKRLERNKARLQRLLSSTVHDKNIAERAAGVTEIYRDTPLLEIPCNNGETHLQGVSDDNRRVAEVSRSRHNGKTWVVAIAEFLVPESVPMQRWNKCCSNNTLISDREAAVKIAKDWIVDGKVPVIEGCPLLP